MGGPLGKRGCGEEPEPSLSLPCGCTVQGALCGFPPAAELPLFLTAPVSQSLHQPSAVFGYVGALLPGPLTFLAGCGGGGLTCSWMSHTHDWRRGGNPGGIFTTDLPIVQVGKLSPIMTTGRLVQNWDLSQVWLIPNPFSLPRSGQDDSTQL